MSASRIGPSHFEIVSQLARRRAGNSGGQAPPKPPCTLERERVQEGPGHEGNYPMTEPEQAHTLKCPGTGPKNGVHLRRVMSPG